jgi:SAM-dependent methyltransferase
VFTKRVACDLCGSTASDLLYAECFASGKTFEFIDRYYAGRIPDGVLQGGKYVLRRCRSCRFIWQAEILDDHYLGLLYSKWVDDDASVRKYAGRSFSELARLVHEISALQYLVEGSAKKLRALDFGAGWGRWCQIANGMGVEAWAAELSTARVTHMKSLGIPICVDIFAETQVFDYINAEQVFEHIPRPLTYFCQLASLLAPGGVMRISVPDASAFEKELDEGTWYPHKDAVHPLEHVNCYTMDCLRTLSSEVDMATLSTRTVCFAYARCMTRGSGSLKTLKSVLARQRAGVIFFRKV